MAPYLCGALLLLIVAVCLICIGASETDLAAEEVRQDRERERFNETFGKKVGMTITPVGSHRAGRRGGFGCALMLVGACCLVGVIGLLVGGCGAYRDGQDNAKRKALGRMSTPLQAAAGPYLKRCSAWEVENVADDAETLAARGGTLILTPCPVVGHALVTVPAPFATIDAHVIDSARAMCTGYRGKRRSVRTLADVTVGDGQRLLVIACEN
jgi:hypothetical protein